MTTPLSQTAIDVPVLYEQDYYQWVLTTVTLLHNRQWNLIDLKHLIEEIEDMGKNNRRELKSRLQILLMHLLKYQYQPEKRSSSWVSTILEQRRQIDYLLQDSPSLQPYCREIFADCYRDAIADASIETKLPLDHFPSNPPFFLEETISFDFIQAILEDNDP